MGISSHVSGQSSTRPALIKIQRQTQGSIRHTSSVEQKRPLGIILQLVEFIYFHCLLLNYVVLWQDARLVCGCLDDIVLTSRMVVDQI